MNEKKKKTSPEKTNPVPTTPAASQIEKAGAHDDLTPLGSIMVSPHAIASIAYHAALQSYGVVGLASKNVINGLVDAIVKDPTKGVAVHYDGQDILIDLYIVVEYGTRITSVAHSVSNTVRFQVEKALGMPVKDVNVHIRALRISELG
jgi:uncharacterized alkaline shock family protein YloU